MGFFSHSYDKPGPGVDPNAPQKRSFFRFFELLSRKFGKLCQVNLIYTFALIPTAIIVFFLSGIVVGKIAEAMGINDTESMSSMLVVGGIAFLNLYISLWGAGPATAGVSYIMRNYTREEHAWVWTDFKDEFKANFKQAIAVFGIDLVMMILFYTAIIYYSEIEGGLGILKYVMYGIILIYTLMHFYIYPLMVTFDLPLKSIYKNSFLFAIGKLPSNIFVLIILIIIHIGLPMLALLFGGRYSAMILCVLYLLEVIITQSLSAFLVNFNAYPKMKKYMLDIVEEGEE